MTTAMTEPVPEGVLIGPGHELSDAPSSTATLNVIFGAARRKGPTGWTR